MNRTMGMKHFEYVLKRRPYQLKEPIANLIFLILQFLSFYPDRNFEGESAPKNEVFFVKVASKALKTGQITDSKPKTYFFA